MRNPFKRRKSEHIVIHLSGSVVSEQEWVDQIREALKRNGGFYA